MSLSTAFAPIEAHNKALVMYQTWGHLDPVWGVVYPVHIKFAVGNYNSHNHAIFHLDIPFEGGPAWFFDVHEYMYSLDLDLGVYEVIGDYRYGYRPKNYGFKCKITKLMEGK